ncbi:odorant receptor 30a-like isoform X2 [Cylas formicarius]|uniref:odorant receptor 30a-like isoform X2 n=1 Tax=Cylas formicarius TaxID=197179 RepID=UPI002958D2C2|nr:odorant receptor 30a-like isoform X2 [Cylas formicarius]
MLSTQRYFRFIRQLMMIIGTWTVQTGELSTLKKRLYQVYAITFQVICTSGSLSLLAEVPALIKTSSITSAAVMDNVGRLMIYVVIMFKIFMWQSKRMLNLLSVALQQDSELAGETNPKIVKIYKKHVSQANNVVTIIFSSGILIGIGVALIGDLNCYMYFKNQKGSDLKENPLPLNLWYPFDKNKYYTLVLLDQNIRPILTCLCIGVVGASINSIVMFLKLQLTLLQHQFRIVDKFEAVEYNLKFLCLKHQKLIEFVEGFNESAKNVILLEYTVSSITIAIIIIQLISSTALANALYESNWYEQSKSVKRILQIMMCRCEKPLRLRIGMFGAMDLDAGVSRLKLGYSYTTLVKN